VRFFDANCRIGRWLRPPAGGIESAQDLLRELDAFRIERALVHSNVAWFYDGPVGNDMLMDEIKGYDRLEPCWVMPAPDARGPMDAEAYVDKAIQAGVRAMYAINSEMQYNFRLTEWMCGDFLQALADRKMPLLFDALASPWPEIHDLCVRYPSLPVICVRPKYREARYLYALMDTCPNFHTTFSFLAQHRCIQVISERFGPKQLIFATDLPHFSPAIPIGMVMYANVTDEVKALVAGGNLEHLLGDVS
jgi:hypothetical protein